MKQKKLEMTLQPLAVFRDPKVALEQYHTPASIAATVLHCVFGEGHIEGLQMADLGCGTGMLAIGCALMGAASVICMDVDEVCACAYFVCMTVCAVNCDCQSIRTHWCCCVRMRHNWMSQHNLMCVALTYCWRMGTI